MAVELMSKESIAVAAGEIAGAMIFITFIVCTCLFTNCWRCSTEYTNCTALCDEQFKNNREALVACVEGCQAYSKMPIKEIVND